MTFTTNTLTFAASRYSEFLSLIEETQVRLNKVKPLSGAVVNFRILREYSEDDVLLLDVETSHPTLVVDGEIEMLGFVERGIEGFNMCYSINKDKSKFTASNYRTVSLTRCDECNVRIPRNKAYILSHDGVEVMVGASCLKKYIPDALAVLNLMAYEKAVRGMDEDQEAFCGGGSNSFYPLEVVVCAAVGNLTTDKTEMSNGTLSTLAGSRDCAKPAKPQSRLVRAVMAEFKSLKDQLIAGAELTDFQANSAQLGFGIDTRKGRQLNTALGIVGYMARKINTAFTEEEATAKFAHLKPSTFVGSAKTDTSKASAVYVKGLVLSAKIVFREGFGFYDKGEYVSQTYVKDIRTGSLYYFTAPCAKLVDQGLLTSFVPAQTGETEYASVKTEISFVATVSGHFENSRGHKVTKLNRLRDLPRSKAAVKALLNMEA